MSKIGKTKKDILKILSKKQQTITDVSHTLNLSPSTVKQHFDELLHMGAIVQVENEFIKRWKYYKVDPSFNVNELKKENTFTNVIPYAIGSVIIIAVIGLFLFYSNYSNSTTNASLIPSTHNYSLTIQLTDPPHVPANTTALILNYSSILIKVLSPNNTQSWVNMSTNGSVNLMSLINTSEILGNIKLTPGYKLEGVVLTAKNANIIIENQTYPVVILNNKIYATVPQNSIINSNSSILIDFSPTVSNIYTNNTTVFIMTPTVKALFYNNFNENKSDKLGLKKALNSSQFELFLNHNSSLSILSSNITQNNNKTKIKINIKNTGNKIVDIKQVMLSGQINSHILLNNRTAIFIHNIGPENDINISITKINFSNNNEKIISAIKTMGSNILITRQYSFNRMIPSNGLYSDNQQLNSSSRGKYFNVSMNNNFNSSFQGNEQFLNYGIDRAEIERFNLSNPEIKNANIGINLVFLHQLVFFVNKNASLEIPKFSLNNIQNNSYMNNFMLNNTGYELSPGSNVTLTFNGNITCGNSFIKGELFNNSSYVITVLGSNGTFSEVKTNTN